MTAAGSGPRYGYVTEARHQMDPRRLVLRGGRLDGLSADRVAAIGQRVFCGDGEWAVEDVYLVTGETATVDGQERFVAVPAFGEAT